MNKKEKRPFDVSFKEMAVELSETKDNLKFAAEELGINAFLLSKWPSRLNRQGNISQKTDYLRLLHWQLRELEVEHAILKKVVRIFSKDGSNATGSSKNTQKCLLW